MAIARVQSKTANSGGVSGTSLAVTLDSTPTAGNFLVAAIASQGACDLAQTGVVWTVVPKLGASNQEGFLAVGKVQSGASATLTISMAASTGSAVAIAEYSGTNVLTDQYVSATGTGTSAASGATGTTSVADELWAGSICARNAVTFSAPTNSFSIVGQDKSSIATTADRSAALLERIVTSTGTANAGATVSSSNVWTAQVLTLREVSGGGLITAPSMAGVPL